MHTNIQTGQYYIGYRCGNKKPPEIDFPKYITSGKIKQDIKANPDNWVSEITCLFFGEDRKLNAYWHEQQEIKTCWGDPLLLNRHYHNKESEQRIFATHGAWTEEKKQKLRGPRGPMSEEKKQKLRGPRGPLSEEERQKRYAWCRKPMSEERKAKYRGKGTGPRGPMSEEAKANKRGPRGPEAALKAWETKRNKL